MEKRKTYKLKEETQGMLFAAWMAYGQATGNRPTYDKVIQEALCALAETPSFKKVKLDSTLKQYKKSFEEQQLANKN